VRGEVSVEIRTDEPDRRFAVGARVTAETNAASIVSHELTVLRARSHRDRLVVSFEGVNDRTAAERLRGLLLLADVSDTEVAASTDEFYDWQLVGMRVLNRGAVIGEVSEVRHSPAQDLLVVQPSATPGPSSTPDAATASETAVPSGEVLIPFVAAMVTGVDLASQTITTDLPDGLIELAEGS
jgi:16S rRNA processing protein RimM